MTEATTSTGNQLVSFFQEEPKRQSNSVGVELLPIDRASGFSCRGPQSLALSMSVTRSMTGN